jgi:hypothetical protein
MPTRPFSQPIGNPLLKKAVERLFPGFGCPKTPEEVVENSLALCS